MLEDGFYPIPRFESRVVIYPIVLFSRQIQKKIVNPSVTQICLWIPSARFPKVRTS